MPKRLMPTIAAGVPGGALALTGRSTVRKQDQATPSSTRHHHGHGSSRSTGSEARMEHPMDGAETTIAGAFNTYTYAVNFMPTTGGDPVKDHKWVVHKEIKDPGDQRLGDGTDVTLEAEHMKGMKGATATIAKFAEETVYMVDYEADGMTMTNHKWVVEGKIQPAS